MTRSSPHPRTLPEVDFVDGVRTPIGRAGGKGIHAGTRAQKALENAGLGIEDTGLVDITEAFAVQVLTSLDRSCVAGAAPRASRCGGATAVGHPSAASGLRLMNQPPRRVEDNPPVRFGLAPMCNRLGMGGAGVWENPHRAGYGTTDARTQTGAAV